MQYTPEKGAKTAKRKIVVCKMCAEMKVVSHQTSENNIVLLLKVILVVELEEKRLLKSLCFQYKIHHQGVLAAQILLTLSRYPSLSAITLDKSF